MTAEWFIMLADENACMDTVIWTCWVHVFSRDECLVQQKHHIWGFWPYNLVTSSLMHQQYYWHEYWVMFHACWWQYMYGYSYLNLQGTCFLEGRILSITKTSYFGLLIILFSESNLNASAIILTWLLSDVSCLLMKTHAWYRRLNLLGTRCPEGGVQDTKKQQIWGSLSTYTYTVWDEAYCVCNKNSNNINCLMIKLAV